MSINLVKGQKVDLTKTNPDVKKFLLGLGWNPNTTSTGKTFDVDASVFILNAAGKRISDAHFIFYNNVDGSGTTSDELKGGKAPNAKFGVLHKGDNKTGEGDGDDEIIEIDFSKMDPAADSIMIVVTIHDAAAKGQNFGQISGSYIRIADATAPTVDLKKFELDEDYSVETAMTFGKLYKKDGEWKFEAVGTGMAGGLQKYVDMF